jgi:hypothetical protein
MSILIENLKATTITLTLMHIHYLAIVKTISQSHLARLKEFRQIPKKVFKYNFEQFFISIYHCNFLQFFSSKSAEVCLCF